MCRARDSFIHDASCCANGDLRLVMAYGTRSAYRSGITQACEIASGIANASGKENNMLGTILLLVLILLLLGAVPAWPYNRQWGYAPSGGIGLVLMVVLILVLLQH